MVKKIQYPYIPDERKILYVPISNKFMYAARKYAEEHSLDHVMPTGTVLVNNGVIVGQGANGSAYHDDFGCERVRLNIPTGQKYELCEGCDPKNHSEVKAISNVRERNDNTNELDAYLWGHWWCCKPCWDSMIAAGIRNVYLLEKSEQLFNKENINNVIGKQFES